MFKSFLALGALPKLVGDFFLDPFRLALLGGIGFVSGAAWSGGRAGELIVGMVAGLIAGFVLEISAEWRKHLQCRDEMSFIRDGLKDAFAGLQTVPPIRPANLANMTPNECRYFYHARHLKTFEQGVALRVTTLKPVERQTLDLVIEYLQQVGPEQLESGRPAVSVEWCRARYEEVRELLPWLDLPPVVFSD